VPRSIRVGPNGVLRLRVGCPASALEPCRGTLRLQLRTRRRGGVVRAAAATRSRARRRVIARARYSIAAGRTKAVKLRLSRPARRLLRKRGTLSVRVVAAKRGGPNIGDDSDSVALKLKSKRGRGRSGRRG
jgi:hypothetical protein